jgi:hypothetical protein
MGQRARAAPGMQENQQVVFLSDGAKTSGKYGSICIPTANM